MGDCVKPLRKSARLLSALLAAGLVFCAGAGLAQDTGGVVYSFGIDQGLRSDSNPGLASPASKSQLTSRTQLSFGLVTETRNQRLAFAAQGVVIAGGKAENGLSEPSVSLSYQRESAATVLNLSAALSRQDVSALNFFTATGDPGEIIVTTAAGTGTQEQLSYNAKLEFGRDAAFGGSVAFNHTELSYLNTTDPSLINNTRDTVRLGLRFDLTETTSLMATASSLRLQEVSAATSRTNSLSLGLQTERTNGKINADLSLTDTPTGQRESLSLGRSYDLPTGQLNVSLGASSRISGGAALIGNLGWQQELPNGKLSLTLSQNITGNASEDETRLSRLGLGYSHEFSPLLSGSFNLGLQDSRDTATSIATRSTDLSIGLRYAVTEDWGLNVGATQRILAKDGNPTADATILTLSVSRSFDFRP